MMLAINMIGIAIKRNAVACKISFNLFIPSIPFAAWLSLNNSCALGAMPEHPQGRYEALMNQLECFYLSITPSPKVA